MPVLMLDESGAASRRMEAGARDMFMGLFGSDVGAKLAGVDQEALRQAGGGPYGPSKRPMGGYVTLPAALSANEAQRWIAASFAYAGALALKKKGLGDRR